MVKKVGAFTLLCLFVTACGPLVPIAKVLSGEVQNGSIISLQGYVSLAFEGQSIYPSLKECEEHNTSRALWIDMPRSKIPESWLNCDYAEVSGVFRADETGHFGGWPSGGIVAVSNVRTVPK